jgi:hypothetical protein
MFNEREQAQFEHVQYVHHRLLALKSSKREPFAVFVIVAPLIYWGTEIIGVSIAIGWIAAMIRGVADDLKRTYLLAEFNRAMCDFEGDLEEMRLRLDIDGAVESAIELPFWRRWL